MIIMRYAVSAILLIMFILQINTLSAADKGVRSGSRSYKDIHGNSYKTSENLFQGQGQNGVRNNQHKRDRRRSTPNKRRR